MNGGSQRIIPKFMEPVKIPNEPAHDIPSVPNPPKPQIPPPNVPAIKAGPRYHESIPQLQPNVQPKQSVPQPLLNLQLYQPEQPKKPNPLAEKITALPLAPFALSQPYVNPEINKYLENMSRHLHTPFIYKDYHINILDPAGNLSTASRIFEDALPSPEIFSSYKTLKERNALCDHVRGTFINTDEGELTDWTGGSHSLNSRLKLTELNPYYLNPYSSNPLAGLPSNIRFYKSCYPIVYDKNTSSVQCNKSSVGMNVRIYNVSLEEFVWKFYNSKQMMMGLKDNAPLQNILKVCGTSPLFTTGTTKKPQDFDVWRELDYYEFIRYNINRKYITPNFVQSYAYFMNKSIKISMRSNGQLFNGIFSDASRLGELEFSRIPQDPSNATMILLTESPEENIVQWCSNQYVISRGVSTLKHAGYKSNEQWNSIIVQMMIVFYTMDKYNFTINEMDFQSNFYIKSLNVFGDNKQYWLFTIGGINYYVPNHGVLLMCDDNYKDIVQKSKYKHKLASSALFNNDKDEVRKTILENAIKCFDANNFGDNFSNLGGVKPPPESLDLFDKIHNELNDIQSSTSTGTLSDNYWADIILNIMLEMGFIHNRVGTLIRDQEVNYVRKNDNRPTPFRKGELAIWEEQYAIYRVVLFVEHDGPQKCKCVSKETDSTTGRSTYQIQTISKSTLLHYSEYEQIKQDAKYGEPLITNDHILEQYIL